MSKSDNLTDFLTDIANTIRAKKGTTALINPQDFESEIASIETGSTENKLAQLVDGTVTEITAEDLKGCTNIRNYAFYSYAGLERIEIPDSVIEIGENAFYKCNNLTSITFGKSVSTIRQSSFYSCSKLKSIVIPDNVKTLSANCFRECTSLESITIGKGVTAILNSAFYGCTKRSKLYIFDIASWCNIFFADSSSNPGISLYEIYLNNELLTNLVIPDGVTSISDYAFYQWQGVLSAEIPASITSIGKLAFSLGTSSNKYTIKMLSTIPPAIQSNSFFVPRLNKIIVPVGTSEAYKAATNWANLADYIEEATE